MEPGENVTAFSRRLGIPEATVIEANGGGPAQGAAMNLPFAAPTAQQPANVLIATESLCRLGTAKISGSSSERGEKPEHPALLQQLPLVSSMLSSADPLRVLS